MLTKLNYSNLVALGDLLLDAERYLKNTKNHLDIGNGKGLEMTKRFAKRHKDASIVYTDSQENIERLLAENHIPSNISLEQHPSGMFDTAAFFLTLHDFQDKKAQINHFSQYLKPSGKLIAIDYDLSWINGNKEEFKKIFSSKIEQQALQKEPDCFEKHTHYSLEKCISEASESGLKTIHTARFPEKNPKFFLYVGEK